MRVLLDESLPRQLARELSGYECSTVQRQGWSGFDNGALLQRAVEEGYRLFLTADQGVEFQQNLARLGVGVVVVRAVSNRMQHLLPLVPAIVEALRTVQHGEVLRVGG